MAQIFLLMMARANPLISILERGDSYRPLVELMGGRVLHFSALSHWAHWERGDPPRRVGEGGGTETLNPWDLPPGQIPRP